MLYLRKPTWATGLSSMGLGLAALPRAYGDRYSNNETLLTTSKKFDKSHAAFDLHTCTPAPLRCI